MRRLLLIGLLSAMMTPATAVAGDAPAASAPPPVECRFESLSVEEQRRYQSRYRRLVRNEGKGAADQWLARQVCMTPAQRKAERDQRRLTRDGKPCTKTRMEMRVSPGYDGAMTMSPVTVCAN